MTYTLEAYGKLNLSLDIIGKRDDGYHDLEMVMQSVQLCDEVTLRCGTGEGGIALTCDDGRLPCDEKNIAYRAAERFFSETGIPCDGVAIHIEKRIPMEAGMAGGSADGAAVLRGLHQHYAPTMPMETLEAMGALVGSDVPFCVRQGTALVQGRGEILATLPSMPPCHLLICKPEFGLSTPALFGRVRVESLYPRPDIYGVMDGLKSKNLTQIAKNLGNVFEQVLTLDEAVEVFAIEEIMLANGALGALMTGSGPTVFGIFEAEATMEKAKSVLQDHNRFLCSTKPV